MLRTTPTPDGLQQWLNAANGLPEDEFIAMSMPSFQIDPPWVSRELGTEAERQKKIVELRKLASDWDAATVAHIFRTDDDESDPAARIRGLVVARAGFRQIARLSVPDKLVVITPFSQGAELVVSGGRVNARLAPFLECLNNMEVWRIKECPVCKKLFWAGRRDKSACGPKCSGNLRQRKLRENRAYKKQLAERKKKRNG